MIRRAKLGRISLADDVRMINIQRGNPIGLNHCCILMAGPDAKIEVGAHEGLTGVVLNATVSIPIGRYGMLGANVRILDYDFHPIHWEKRRVDPKTPEKPQPVILEEDVFVGTDAIILKGGQWARERLLALAQSSQNQFLR